MNDVVFENLLCDAAAQLREERLEKIKLPHKNRHILRAFAVCVCAAILSLAVVYAVPSMRAQLFSLLQIEEESDWILRFESQLQRCRNLRRIGYQKTPSVQNSIRVKGRSMTHTHIVNPNMG